RRARSAEEVEGEGDQAEGGFAEERRQERERCAARGLRRADRQGGPREAHDGRRGDRGRGGRLREGPQEPEDDRGRGGEGRRLRKREAGAASRPRFRLRELRPRGSPPTIRRG